MKTPHEYAQELMLISDKYSKAGELYNNLRKVYAEYYKTFRDTYKSDAGLDRAFDLTTEGQEMAEAKLKMKTLEHKASAIKNYLRVMENESRNQY